MVSVLTVALSLALGLYLRPSSYATPYLFFYPAVLIALWFGGFGAGLLSTLLTAVVVDWFFLLPYGAASLNLASIARGIFFCLSFGLICWLIDVRRVRAEAEIDRQIQLLTESEAQFRNLANAIPQLCWMANDNGWIFWYNQGWYEYTGTTPVQMEGWGWQSVHDPDVLPKVLESWKDSIYSGRPFEMVFPLRGADGVFRPFLTRVNPVRDESGKVVRWFGTNTDISSQKKAEEALLRSEKLAALGRMAATIAHELNNPLAAVMNSIYIANSDSTLSAQTQDALRIADQELRRAAHITAQTLVFCRETGTRSPLELPKVIDEVIGVYARKLRDRGITVQQRHRCGPCGENCDSCFVGNAGELRQVVSNMLGNALDALQDNGTLHVRLCRTSSLDDGPKVRLTMADNGCGIRTEYLKRVFEPFFTTKDSMGTGLGLWITEQIVQRYGGSVRVRSQSGKGTVFCITFPATIPNDISSSQPEPGTPEGYAASG